MAEGTSIDTRLGTEYTKWVEPEPYPVGIVSFVRDKEEGAREAKRQTTGPSEVSF